MHMLKYWYDLYGIRLSVSSCSSFLLEVCPQQRCTVQLLPTAHVKISILSRRCSFAALSTQDTAHARGVTHRTATGKSLPDRYERHS